MRAIILAAGRGSRLKDSTEDKPKGLLPLAGKPLLEWQLAALRGGGVQEVCIVTGYKAEMISPYADKVFHNPDWNKTNMVMSLMCARSVFDTPVVVSYADIVYGKDIVANLVNDNRDIVVAYDIFWRELWEQRFDDPLADAESFRIDSSGKIWEIGESVLNIEDVQGQYMGLLRFSPAALGWLQRFVADYPNKAQKMDMTTLLRSMIGAGRDVYGSVVRGGWCEIDTPTDHLLAERLYLANKLDLE